MFRENVLFDVFQRPEIHIKIIFQSTHWTHAIITVRRGKIKGTLFAVVLGQRIGKNIVEIIFTGHAKPGDNVITTPRTTDTRRSVRHNNARENNDDGHARVYYYAYGERMSAYNRFACAADVDTSRSMNNYLRALVLINMRLKRLRWRYTDNGDKTRQVIF